MENKFEKPELTIIYFVDDDIITDSIGGTDDNGGIYDPDTNF